MPQLIKQSRPRLPYKSLTWEALNECLKKHRPSIGAPEERRRFYLELGEAALHYARRAQLKAGSRVVRRCLSEVISICERSHFAPEPTLRILVMYAQEEL